MIKYESSKVVAIEHHFSSFKGTGDTTAADAVQLFDALMLCNTDQEIEESLSTFEAVIWYIYEDCTPDTLKKEVSGFAEHLDMLFNLKFGLTFGMLSACVEQLEEYSSNSLVMSKKGNFLLADIKKHINEFNEIPDDKG